MELGQSITGVGQAGSGNQAGGGWVFPGLLVVVLLLGVGFVAAGARDPQPHVRTPTAPDRTPAPRPEGPTVELLIDFGNGATKHFAALPWTAGMTVAELMQQAVRFRPGIAYTQQGDGEAGLLTSLDRFGNRGSSGPNWRYHVNGQLGSMSFCRQKLDPGDRVLWRFAEKE